METRRGLSCFTHALQKLGFTLSEEPIDDEHTAHDFLRGNLVETEDLDSAQAVGIVGPLYPGQKERLLHIAVRQKNNLFSHRTGYGQDIQDDTPLSSILPDGSHSVPVSRYNDSGVLVRLPHHERRVFFKRK
jgi:hypothetical protein